MSLEQDEEKKTTPTQKFIPRIIISNNKLKYVKCNNEDLLKNFKNSVSPKVVPLQVQFGVIEDVIYESQDGDFLKLDPGEKIFIVNRLNLATNSSRTVALMNRSRPIGSSDAIVNLIGQKNYDVLFSALCSVISLELKVRGILALLLDNKLEDKLSENAPKQEKNTEDKICQTTETCMEIIVKQKQRKRIKRQHLMPYVVKDSAQIIQKVVISPQNFNKFADTPESLSSQQTAKKNICPENFNRFSVKPESFTETRHDRGSTLPTLTFIDEDSNASIGNLSSFSVNTLPHLLENPNALLDNIEKCTESNITSLNNSGNVASVCNPTMLTLLDGTQVQIPVKPEDDFHIATSDILRSVPPEYRRKLLLYQAYLDWAYCLQRDEDGYLPLHNAVQSADVDMVRRHCVVLKMRNESVDAVAGDMTALQMSLYQNCPQTTALLLEFGADPLVTDSENRTCLHLAAEESTDHLRTIINYCRANPMRILSETEEFWKPELESQTKEEQAQYLLDKLSQLTDSQGYTPLMVASKIGNYDHVKTLVEISPKTINLQMPNSGDTALYLAVGAACMDASNRGNLSKVTDNFMKTIQILVENGAEPAIDNHSGSNVNLLLSEFKIRDLSMLVADALSAINCDIISSAPDTIDTFKQMNYMLVKDEKGNVDVQEMQIRKYKPIILENIRIDSKIVKIDKNTTNIDDKPTNEDNMQFINTYESFIKNGAPKKPVIPRNKKLIILKKSSTKPSTSKIVSNISVIKNKTNSNTDKSVSDSKTKIVKTARDSDNKIVKTATNSVTNIIKTASDSDIKIVKTTTEVTSPKSGKSNAKTSKASADTKIVENISKSSTSIEVDIEQDYAIPKDNTNKNKVREKLKRFLNSDSEDTQAKIPKL